MISSSVWSTLMTSSMRRWMLLAKSFAMACAVIIGSSSEDLRPVVVFRVEHAHERQTGGAVERTGVEEHGGYSDASLELFEEGERPVHGEERAGAEDEHNVEVRVALLGELGRDQVDERCVFREDR